MLVNTITLCRVSVCRNGVINVTVYSERGRDKSNYFLVIAVYMYTVSIQIIIIVIVI